MQAGPDTLLHYSPLLFLVFFVAVWILASLLISFVGGWHALSARFAQQSEPYGDTRTAGPFFYGVYTRFWTHYSGIIRMTTTKDALYLSVLFLFSAGHPPLCIPWNEIQIGRTKCLWCRYVVLTLGRQERIPMRISERMARNLGILERLAEAAPPA